MVVRTSTIKSNSSTSKNLDRFNLNSGERQVATQLDEIRNDHFVRYKMVADFLGKLGSRSGEFLGADVFCGNGYGSFLIATETNAQIIGIDASKDAIALANESYSTNKSFFSVKRFPFELPVNVFDFVVSFETIEHVKEDKELIYQLDRSLKNGGYLFVSVPNEEICSYEKNNYEFHIKHYFFDEIINMLDSISQYELITWYGNGAYDFAEGVYQKHRDPSQMLMKEKEADSHIIYVLQKIGKKSESEQ